MSLADIATVLTETRVRQMRAGDLIPGSLDIGFKTLDPEWAWVGLVTGDIVAVLLAAPCHDHVFLVRLVVEPQHGAILPALLRTFIRDIASRGYRSYFTFFDKERSAEVKILRILKHAGKVEECPTPQWFMGGRISDLEKW